MKRFSGLQLGLLWLGLTTAASATSLTIDSWNLMIGNGGGFIAHLTGDSTIFSVFGVDYLSDATIDNPYPVNIDILSVTDADTRYGTTPEAAFTAQMADGVSLGTAYNRYLLAGWLTTQYDSNAAGSRDIGIQNAIWTLLHVDGTVHANGDETTWLNNAVIWETSQTQAQLDAFAGAVRIYSDTSISPNTNLVVSSATSRYIVGPQEVLNVTPEPAALGLAGIGLIMLGLRKRYAKP